MAAPAAPKQRQHTRRHRAPPPPRPHLYPALILTLCLAHHLTPTAAAGCDVGSYAHYPSVTSPGADLPLASPPSRFTPQSLAALCNKTPGCVAFDSLGNLKSSVDLGALKQVPNALGLACFGLYVNRDDSAGSRWLGFRVEPKRMAQHLQACNSSYGEYSSLMKRAAPYRTQASGDVVRAAAAAGVQATAMRAALTVPLVYDARSSYYTGGLRLMTPVRTQGSCGACVAFTTLAAAEAAVAKSLRISSSNTMDFSEQALFFCGDMSGSCAEGWDLLSAGQVLQRGGITWEACLPYRGAYSCAATSTCSPAPDGAFSWTTFSSVLDLQQHIVQWGAIAAVFYIYEDFYRFWNSRSTGVYRRQAGARLMGGHAVTVVGWDANQQYWIAKNSWGTSGGENGYFKIGFGQAGIMTPGENGWTTGVMFGAPNQQSYVQPPAFPSKPNFPPSPAPPPPPSPRPPPRSPPPRPPPPSPRPPPPPPRSPPPGTIRISTPPARPPPNRPPPRAPAQDGTSNLIATVPPPAAPWPPGMVPSSVEFSAPAPVELAVNSKYNQLFTFTMPSYFPAAKAAAAQVTITLTGQPVLQYNWYVSNTVLLATSSGTWLYAPYVQLSTATTSVSTSFPFKGASALKAGALYRVGVYCFFNGWSNLQVNVKVEWAT